MLEATPTTATPGGTTGVVFLKNYSYTYAWFYMPPLPVKLQ